MDKYNTIYLRLPSCFARRLCWSCSTTRPFWTPASRF